MDNADLVVYERPVHVRNFNSWHVTARTVLCAYGTRCARVIAYRFRAPCCKVAVEALPIISGKFLHQRDVRVVTSHAGYSRVSPAPTLAVVQPIRLCAHGAKASRAGMYDVHPCAVARAAKVHRIIRAQSAGIEDQIRCMLVSDALLENAGLHAVGMLCAGAMTSFTGDAGGEFARLEFACDHGSRAVAREAAPDFTLIDGARHGFFEILRRKESACGSEMEIL